MHQSFTVCFRFGIRHLLFWFRVRYASVGCWTLGFASLDLMLSSNMGLIWSNLTNQYELYLDGCEMYVSNFLVKRTLLRWIEPIVVAQQFVYTFYAPQYVMATNVCNASCVSACVCAILTTNIDLSCAYHNKKYRSCILHNVKYIHKAAHPKQLLYICYTKQRSATCALTGRQTQDSNKCVQNRVYTTDFPMLSVVLSCSVSPKFYGPFPS